MNTVEHLTETQLSDYLGNAALDKETKHRIGRHLLQCDFCLKRLPPPTTEQFWVALMTDEGEDDSPIDKTTLAERLSFIAQLLKQPKILVWSASALLIVLFFSAFIWLNAAKSSEMEREIAENFETVQPVFNRNRDEKTNFSARLPNAENSNRSTVSSTRVASERNSPTVSNNSLKQKSGIAPRNNPNTKIETKLPDDKSVSVSTTRGGVLPKCRDRPPLELKAEAINEAVVLKWNKIRGAAKYHLYVSDDEEILVDEFETEQETSYVLKKPLDPTKTYQWKVVITLEDGSRVAGDSQKFTIKDLRENKKSEKKKKPDVRCSAIN